MKTSLFLSMLFASIASIASIASASTFHVAPTGDDSAAGTVTQPFLTIQHAADRVQPGDTVIVHAGTYTGFTTGAQGTAAAPIVFTADGTVDIDGAATADRDAIHIEGASYVTVEGFTVTHATRSGISALSCDHITIRNNVADQNAKWGIFSAFCEDLTVEDNQASRSGEQHGIYASNSADHPVIRGNTVWGNAMCGIHMNGDISQGGDGVISNALVENNYIHDNGLAGGSAINGDGVADSVIRNNVLDDNHASGISLYQIDGGAPSTGNLVINNTIRMAATARFAVNIQNGAARNTLRNNILLDTVAGRGAIDISSDSLPGFASDHNAVTDAMSVDGTVMTLSAWKSRTGTDAGSFASTSAQLLATDLSLAAGSLAIDAGSATDAPATDLAGTARPQGAAVDIGAYEHCDGACAGFGSGSGSGSDSAGSDGSAGDTGSSGDNPGSDYSGPAHAPSSGGGCAVGGNAGIAIALAVLLVRRRRR